MKVINKNFISGAFLSFALIPILPPKIMGLPVVLFVIACICTYVSDPHYDLNYKKLCILILPYLAFCISIFFSNDYEKAVKMVIETRLSLFLIPFSFFILNSSVLEIIQLQLKKFYKYFCFSTLVMCVLYFSYLPFAPISENPNFRFPSGFFFKSSLSSLPLWEPEPVYFSFIIVVAFILLAKLFYEKQIKLLTFFGIAIFYLSVILLLVSKIALIFIGCFVLWFVLYAISSRKLRVVIIAGMFIITYPISQIPAVKYEIEEVVYFLEGKKRAKDDPNDKRNKIMLSALELAAEINPLTGVGTGDVQDKLNEVYAKKGYEELLVKKYDTHNQFMSFYLSTGIFGFISILFLLIYLVRLCLLNNDYFLLALILYLSFQMLTENLLERQLSVFIFSIYSSIIIFLKNEKVF